MRRMRDSGWPVRQGEGDAGVVVMMRYKLRPDVGATSEECARNVKDDIRGE